MGVNIKLSETVSINKTAFCSPTIFTERLCFTRLITNVVLYWLLYFANLVSAHYFVHISLNIDRWEKLMIESLFCAHISEHWQMDKIDDIDHRLCVLLLVLTTLLYLLRQMVDASCDTLH